MGVIANFVNQSVNEAHATLWVMPVTLVRNYTVHGYYRVGGETASTVMLETSWQDGSGAQSLILAGGSHDPGSYSCEPVFFTAVSGTDIRLAATTTQPGKLHVSSTIKVL